MCKEINSMSGYYIARKMLAFIIFMVMLGAAGAAQKKKEAQVDFLSGLKSLDDPKLSAKLVRLVTDSGCAIYVYPPPFYGPPLSSGALWTGDCVDGLASGVGVVAYGQYPGSGSITSPRYIEARGLAVAGVPSGVWVNLESTWVTTSSWESLKRIVLAGYLHLGYGDMFVSFGNDRIYPINNFASAVRQNPKTAEKFSNDIYQRLNNIPTLSKSDLQETISRVIEDISCFPEMGAPSAAVNYSITRPGDDPPVSGGGMSFE